MADYLSQGVFQPSIPLHLVTLHDLKIFNAFGITMTPDGEDKLYLVADDWCTTGTVVTDDGQRNEYSEDILYACLQRIIRRSHGGLIWISKETAYTCTENMADGFGGSAVFITADEVRYFGTSSWLERNISEAEAGKSHARTEEPLLSKSFVRRILRRSGRLDSEERKRFGEEVNEPTNEERAGRIDTVMRAYCLKLEDRDFDGDEDDVKDLLADLMHFCERMEVDFEENLRVARDNYEHERETETGMPNLP